MDNSSPKRLRSHCVNDELESRMRRGDCNALSILFHRHWAHLERRVDLRMHHGLSGRLDAADVLQEAYVNAEKRLDNFRCSPTNSFLTWISMIIQQTLFDITRKHIQARKRSVQLERRIHRHSPSGMIENSSCLMDPIGTPSENVSVQESKNQLMVAMQRLDLIDQQVIYLRHFEDKSNQAVADSLGMSPKNASIRYVRALAKLRKILESQLP